MSYTVARTSERAELTLPWPPSVNEYWHHTRTGHTFISKAGRTYRELIQQLCLPKKEPLAGSLRMQIIAYPPDRRRRDLDNVLKALLDALQHGGIIESDHMIDELSVSRQGVGDKLGLVKIFVDKVR